MSICCCCRSWGDDPLCGQCSISLVPAAPAELPGGIRVAVAFAHEATARRLVHMLKYQGIEAAGSVLARAMLPLVPARAAALVPLPRAILRRARYGTDPALVLAKRLGAETDLPVVRALAPQLWWPAHAGSSRNRRQPPRFRVVRSVPAGGVLIDDVLTTGATIVAAAAVTGVQLAVAATRAGE